MLALANAGAQKETSFEFPVDNHVSCKSLHKINEQLNERKKVKEMAEHVRKNSSSVVNVSSNNFKSNFNVRAKEMDAMSNDSGPIIMGPNSLHRTLRKIEEPMKPSFFY